MTISSAQNPQLKLIKRLQRRRAREQEGLFVVEGEDLVAAGIETGAVLRTALVDSERRPGMELPAEFVLAVEPELLAGVSELAHPPRVIGVFELPSRQSVVDAMASSTGPWIVCDGVADPGNVGTIIRSVAALGGGGVVLRPGSADPFSGKAIRASMGSCFRVPLAWSAEVEELVASGARIIALDAGGDVQLSATELDERTLLIIGGERDGISDHVRAAAHVIASIPQDPNVESLNAGVAASLALYEWRRLASTSV